MEVVIIALAAIPLIAVMFFVATLLNGWALHLLWAWFVVPVFDALPALTTGQAIGISMIVSFLTYQYVPEPKESKSSAVGAGLTLIIRPLLAVLFGLIIKHFI